MGLVEDEACRSAQLEHELGSEVRRQEHWALQQFRKEEHFDLKIAEATTGSGRGKHTHSCREEVNARGFVLRVVHVAFHSGY